MSLVTQLFKRWNRYVHSMAMGGKPAQASQDAVRDAVFANAGACTAAGVTLRL
ncbi:hypothetical protein [Pseudarthrobacter enclensis]|uniref:Uncharacterized protein n=1 Tax=Pseudarthrobacter enclensis TaxID=993070 RepID=A0ABT9RPK7_9MICC|nr:hypothetical protein [Pseudarthrobacter enclensis]MDP9887167.1 hypothetical protein [Pseudarthrobacter enclensis]